MCPVIAPCTRKLLRFTIIVALLGACASPPPPAPLPTVRSPEEALATARAFAAGGEYEVAERLLAARTRPPPQTEGSEAMMNSRVLQLRAQIASEQARTADQSRRAEALAAWAVWESPLTADAWITYAEVRRRSEGYATFVASIEAREIRRYDGMDAGAPRVLARLPDADDPADWLFLRALVQAVEGQTDPALATLGELRRFRRPCRGEHLLALLNARAGRWDALRDGVSVLESSGNCADVRGSPSYQRARARLALASGNRRLALEALREALRFDPTNPEAGAELAGLERPGVVVQAASMADDEVYRVRASPYEWSAWAALWRSTGMESPARSGRFLALAEQAAREQPAAAAPRLAVALARIRASDYGSASLALGPMRASSEATRELLECRLVLALALSDARGIRTAADAFNRSGAAPLALDAPSGWGEVLRLADRPAEDEARRAAIAVFLEGASRRDGSRLFIRAAANSFLGTMLPATPAGQAHALALLEGRTDLLGQGLSELDGRVDETETELLRLNEYAVALASRVTGVEAEAVRQARELRLTQAQVARLETEIQRVAQELPRMEARLVAAMERGDERILRIVDQLSAEVRAHRGELRGMGLRLDALEQGRTASKRAIMADILTVAGAALSWAPGVGWGFNLIGLLTGLGAMYLGNAEPALPAAPLPLRAAIPFL